MSRTAHAKKSRAEARVRELAAENARLKSELELWRANVTGDIAAEAKRLGTENTLLRGQVESIAVDFERRAALAAKSCACCSSAISEARWRQRGLTWGHAAAQVRALLAAADKSIDRQPEQA